jgi:diacylglycerol kinase (ATP)
MSGLGIVVNPLAKYYRKNRDAKHHLEARLGPNDVLASSNSLTHLERIAEDFKARQISLLAISGGDGTGSHTLSIFDRVYGSTPMPPVALLRGGTMNTSCNGIGIIRGHPHELLDRIIRRLNAGKSLATKRVGTVRCNGQAGFVFGIGVIPNFLEEYYARGRPFPSPTSAAMLLGRCIFSALVQGPFVRKIVKPVSVDVIVDGYRWPETEYFTLGAATVPQIGLGFTPFYHIDETHAQFQIIGFHCGPIRFMMDLPLIYRGVATGSDHTTQAMANRAVLRGRNGKFTYTIDGDLFDTEELVVETGPSFDVVLP